MEKRNISFSPPDISELEISEVTEALRSGWITTGPRTKLLERRLAAFIETGRTDIDCEIKENIAKYSHRVVCLESATSAEELNFRILGVGPGDEVIVPAYTYTASASAAIHCGAKVVFVDTVKPDGANDTHAPEMNYQKLTEAINERTKAIVTVDIGGVVCDYDKVFEAVQSRKACFVPMEDHSDGLRDINSRIQSEIGRAAIVADSAHSLGAWRNVGGRRLNCGQIADFTSYSFHAVKNFTTAEGGASTWLPLSKVTNDEIYKYYQLLSLHGQNKDAMEKTTLGAWEYDIIGSWYKCNMTDITASIGLGQLERYLDMLKRRSEIVEKYDKICDELGLKHLMHHTRDMQSSNHLYLVRVPGITSKQRTRIIEKMAEEGIVCNVHYKPLPMMTAYKNMGWDIRDFPNAYGYFENLISLPLHTRLSEEDVAYISDILKKIILREYCDRTWK